MAEPIPIRAHSLLCMLGFRGEGYSPRFVRELTAVHRRLSEDPSTLVEVRVSPDVLCDACPHLRRGCTLGGPDHETHMRLQDEDVARRLGLLANRVYLWSDILDRVARSVRGTDLPGICTTCPWLANGWCAEGIEALRAERGTAVTPPA